MSLLEQAGLAGGDSSQFNEYPSPVKGRVVHIDADFLSYQVSAETKDEREKRVPLKSDDELRHNAEEAALHIMRRAGGTEYVAHVTPSGSTKGGRDDQAVQAEYQASRKARTNRPERLDLVRDWFVSGLGGVGHMHQEADDGMAQAGYADLSDRCVIASADKDLRMVPGWKLDMQSGELVNVDDPFGYISVDDSKSSKKVVGYGTKFFWAQLLMGDPADGIIGAPVVAGYDYLPVAPTKAYTKLRESVEECSHDDPHRAALLARLVSAHSATKNCGPMLAYNLLWDAKTDAECFNIVKRVFRNAGTTGYNFVHWRTREDVTAMDALKGDMLLLWMRRNDNQRDVFDWLRSVI